MDDSRAEPNSIDQEFPLPSPDLDPAPAGEELHYLYEPANYRRSPSLAKLVTALAKAQGQMTNVGRDAENTFFHSNYATLGATVNTRREALSTNGLAIMHFPTSEGAVLSVTTLLIHSSGEFVESTLTTTIVGKIDSQALGSATTYLKRYQEQALLALAADDDDDGNTASGKELNPEQKAKQAESREKAHAAALKVIDTAKAELQEAAKKGLDALAAKFNSFTTEVKRGTLQEKERLKAELSKK